MSDFGKGFTYCLGLFLAHQDKLGQVIEQYEELGLKENHVVQLWFNGASDHLFELEVPEEFRSYSPKTATLVDHLKERSIQAGHGLNRNTNREEAHRMLDIAKIALRVVDEWMGVEIEKGEWE